MFRERMLPRAERRDESMMTPRELNKAMMLRSAKWRNENCPTVNEAVVVAKWQGPVRNLSLDVPAPDSDLEMNIADLCGVTRAEFAKMKHSFVRFHSNFKRFTFSFVSCSDIL